MKLSPGLSRPRFASALPRQAPAIAVGLLLGAAAVWVAVYWLGKVIAPRPVASLPESRPAQRPVADAAALRIFSSGGAAQPGASLGNVVVTGVFASADGRGFATFRLAQGAKGVRVGQEVMPGVTLARVEKERVVLGAGGVEHSLTLLKERPPAMAGAAPANTPTANHAAPAAHRDH